MSSSENVAKKNRFLGGGDPTTTVLIILYAIYENDISAFIKRSGNIFILFIVTKMARSGIF
jgi:hypothetical protein